MNWFKFYGQDYLTDLKLIRLRIEDRLCFITLLCLASASDEQGIIKNCDEDSIIKLTHLHDDPYESDNEHNRAIGFLKRLEDIGIVTRSNEGHVTVNNFVRRQQTNLTNAERQARHREKIKNTIIRPKYDDSNNSNEARVTKVTLDKIRLDKIREDNNISDSPKGSSGGILKDMKKNKTIEVDSMGEEIREVDDPKYRGKMGSDVHKIGYHYCQAANDKLRRLKEKPLDNPLLLREGAGTVLVKRLKKYGFDEIVRRLKIYMDSDKFVKYPQLTAALSSDTFTQLERETLK